MEEPQSQNGANELAFEAFGARALVSVESTQHLDRIASSLPRGWKPCSPSDVERRFELISDAGGRFQLRRDGVELSSGLTGDLALSVLESQLRGFVSLSAPESIFIHAGAVTHLGRAIVVPGKSFAGKTTLVGALVRAGATYYSDEFAVVDDRGLIHPYAKPLSVRTPDNSWEQTEHTVESFGGVAGVEPVPIGLIAVLHYRPGAQWRPTRLSPGEGTLELMEHTVVAQERPEAALRAVARAVGSAAVLKGERGEAEEIAPTILEELETHVRSSAD